MDIFADNTEQTIFPSFYTVDWDATGLFSATALLMVFHGMSIGWLCFCVFSDPTDDHACDEACNEDEFEK